jgi:predicted ATPase
MVRHPMIKSVEFKNFKVLRDATLPLSRCTLLIGPNGSGKSTALQALQVPVDLSLDQVLTMDLGGARKTQMQIGDEVTVVLNWDEPYQGVRTKIQWARTHGGGHVTLEGPANLGFLRSISAKVYALDAAAIAAPVSLNPAEQLESNGGRLAGVLDRIRDRQPEAFKAINDELSRWIPEYDQILFDTPSQGMRAFLLRTRRGGNEIHAGDLSHGTLFALAILTLAYTDDLPTLVGFEEPDRGIHPRLLRDVRDALYRLSYPETCGLKQEPVQVVVTTHNPYFLDLFRDHPDEIVIAQKGPDGAFFERLSELPDLEDIMQDAQLSELWYSGVLGGVPVGQ